MTPVYETHIVNLALSLLGIDPIVSIEPPDADSKPARSGALWYDQARRDTLQAHPWNFASARVEIAAQATGPAFEYSNRYQKPFDFIRINRLGQNWDDPIQDYEEEGDYILCNESSPLKLVYVYDFKQVGRFSAKFVTALAFRLAQLMAKELTGNDTLMTDMGVEFDKVVSQGMSIDGQNRPTRRVQRSRLADARTNTGIARNWRSWSTT